MKYYKYLILTTYFSIQLIHITNAQAISKDTFIKTVDSLMSELYNITHLPTEFYDCGYSKLSESNDLNFDLGYTIATECLYNDIEKIKFSDDGLKFLKKSENPFVNGCTTANTPYKEVIFIPKFCQCLYQEYLKYEVGFETIVEPDFSNTIFSQKMTEYCFNIHKKN